MLSPLMPPRGYFPDFLTPAAASGGLECGVDAVLATPRRQLRTELGLLSISTALPGWTRRLAEGEVSTVHRLGRALRVYHASVLAPGRPDIAARVESDRRHRTGTQCRLGTEEMLRTFAPILRWESPVLTADYPGWRSSRPAMSSTPPGCVLDDPWWAREHGYGGRIQRARRGPGGIPPPGRTARSTGSVPFVSFGGAGRTWGASTSRTSRLMRCATGLMLDDMERVSAAAIIDVQGVVTGWSEGAGRLTGLTAEEAVGRPVRDLLAEQPSPAAVAALTGTAVLRHRDGSPVALNVTACAVLGEDGGPGGYVITAVPSDAHEPTADVHEPTLAERAFQQASMSMSVFDTEQRYLRLNEAACKVMGVEEEVLLGRHFPETVQDEVHSRGFLWHMRRVAETGMPLRYESYTGAPALNREHAWTTDMWPVRDASGRLIGTALAAFDSSDQYWARQRLALLNEAAATIGTTLDVVRTAEELISVMVPRFADFASVDLFDWVLGAEEPPALSGTDIALRRVAHGSGTEGTPEAAVHLGEVDYYPPFSPPARAIMEGRVIQNQAGEPAFMRWIAERNSRSPAGRRHRVGAHSMMAAPLRARGTTLGVAVAVRIRQSDDYGADDAVFAEELASRAAVCVDNARRFARERTTALSLQHNLLPRGLSGQAAVDVAHRYRPSGSQAGIGGDWFDVIPLSGSRVALVVGDVVGHGIPSSATMGRLCTAVRTLADVDLPPDELLTHLDDLVIHLAGDDSDEVAELGATCLYSVYDPVSRHLTLASAGHPPPALVLPDGTTQVLEMNAGPPLGVGGLPFEAMEVGLPEGSLVALYTDGLIEDRDRDIDHATAELCRALTAPAESLDALCDTVLKAVLPEDPSDDVALLLARTRALGVDRIATWDVQPDPEHVAATRQAATDQLTSWGLDEAAFVTELVVSELVTNAIRYGAPPIQLRLIRDRTLICEVSDGSSTSPHLRRAHAYDEGGRGLLLVAQLTQRWGSRQTGGGKTIWAEQPLPPT